MKKRKDGRYAKELFIDGKRHTFYGTTQSEVYYKIRMFEEKQEQGRTFSEVADEWEEKHRKEISYNAMNRLSTSKKRIVEVLGDTPIKDLKPQAIENYIENFCDTLKPAHKTALRELSVIKMVCKYAVIKGDLEINPALYITVPRGLARTKRDLPSDEDMKKIIDSVNVPFGLFAYFSIFTGMRRGEVLAIQYEDIDFQNKTINVNKAIEFINNRPKIKPPKTQAGIRIVPLLSELEKELNPKGTGYVFLNSKGELYGESQFQRAYTKYRKESGVECTSHQVRYGMATILYESNIDDKDAQLIMGHADIITTRNMYTHIREARRKQTAEELEKFTSNFRQSLE